jgi:hypothetical protein
MAKTDAFFLRKTVNIGDDGNFYQDEIDLGAYVDALGKAVLRIHNIAVSWTDSAARTMDMDANSVGSADFQLTTQSQSNMVLSGTDKSVIASGRLTACRQISGAGTPSIVSEALDVAPQQWTKGYLVGVDTIYLGGAATSAGWAEDVYANLVIECTSESLSKEAAMALALSQQ